MSEDDLVLCERAAKAAGVKVKRGSFMGFAYLKVVADDHGVCKADGWFCPLADDAQAFRLAMHLLMDISTGRYGFTVHHKGSGVTTGGEWSPDDATAKLRRVIVLVAAGSAP